jgi:glycosyltransferase involved in cell wall biosynthesis
MKGNIWVINQFAGKPTSGWGERHYYFSKYWIDKGYSVTIFSGSYNHVFSELPQCTGQFTAEDVEGVKFCWVKTPKYNAQSIFRFWSFIVFALKMFFAPSSKYGKPDFILVSSMPIFPILTGYLLKKRFRSRALFFEIRDIWPLTLVLLGNISPKHPAVKFIGWFEKFGYRKADKVVSLLPNAAEHLEEVAQASAKFHYIPNGLDENVLEKELARAEDLEKIPSDKFVIGYAGTIGLANALEFFVEAAGLMKTDSRFYFVIIGDGYLKEELIKSSHSFGNICFLPKVRKNQVAAYLQKFDVCFVGRNDSPLFKHGVSANKYFDYMLAGKPILDSNNLIKDPVELSGCGIIVEPDSAEAIVKGIYNLFEMTKEERMTMGQLGYSYVKDHHSIEHLSSEYITLFESFTKE